MLPLPESSDPKQFDELIAAARAAPPTPRDVALLAQRLANSGERLKWPASAAASDVASTGGPGSLSTLLTPLALRAMGCRVPKLAVPGRPAGAIDTLGTIPGYRTRLKLSEVRELMHAVGFAHFLADERFAPMDAALFAYRRSVNAVGVPALVAASLLAKKIAVGVQRVGLDVRVGTHGNFGETVGEARNNARVFCEAALEVGLDAVAFLATGPTPAQPWIGRGESLLALAVAVGAEQVEDRGGWLSDHVSRCMNMASETARPRSGANTSDAVSIDGLREVLSDHLSSQGASWDGFMRRVKSVATALREPVRARATGRLRIDLRLIRSELVNLQGGAGAEPFGDPAGIEILARQGALVAKGQAVARIRCDGGSVATASLATTLARAFSTEPASEPAAVESEGLEVIRA